jgi:hypothetical protein
MGRYSKREKKVSQTKKFAGGKFPQHSQYEKKRLQDILERDALLLVGVQGWRRQAGNGEEWRQLWDHG